VLGWSVDPIWTVQLLSWGLAPPDEHVPNFWLEAESRAATRDAAFAVVAVLTAVFGGYAG